MSDNNKGRPKKWWDNKFFLIIGWSGIVTGLWWVVLFGRWMWFGGNFFDTKVIKYFGVYLFISFIILIPLILLVD